jgi:hypothetical protein
MEWQIFWTWKGHVQQSTVVYCTTTQSARKFINHFRWRPGKNYAHLFFLTFILPLVREQISEIRIILQNMGAIRNRSTCKGYRADPIEDVATSGDRNRRLRVPIHVSPIKVLRRLHPKLAWRAVGCSRVGTVARNPLPPQERRRERRIVAVSLDTRRHRMGTDWYRI